MGSRLSAQGLSQRRTHISTTATLVVIVVLVSCLGSPAEEVAKAHSVAGGVDVRPLRTQFYHSSFPLISPASSQRLGPIPIRFITRGSKRFKTNRDKESISAKGQRGQRLYAAENLVIRPCGRISFGLEDVTMRRGPPYASGLRLISVLVVTILAKFQIPHRFVILQQTATKIRMTMIEDHWL
jgi:hypothetical protein